MTSIEATAGVAAGPLTPGGPTSLVTANPGSNTLDILDGLGGGLFANPVTIPTQQTAQVVRMADLAGNGIADLAVLSSQGVSIFLGDGRGGFSGPVTYDAGPDPTGLTIADINGDGIPDLLIGNAYGDLLILQGNGNGTFRPYREANQDIALAVADLTGNGKPDFIYADQSLVIAQPNHPWPSGTCSRSPRTGLREDHHDWIRTASRSENAAPVVAPLARGGSCR